MKEEDKSESGKGTESNLDDEDGSRASGEEGDVKEEDEEDEQ